jgi:hypothetical protein
LSREHRPLEVEMREDGRIARRELVVGRALSLVTSVAGEVHLRVGHLNDLDDLVDCHAAKVRLAGEIRQNEQSAGIPRAIVPVRVARPARRSGDRSASR